MAKSLGQLAHRADGNVDPECHECRGAVQPRAPRRLGRKVYGAKPKPCDWQRDLDGPDRSPVGSGGGVDEDHWPCRAPPTRDDEHGVWSAGSVRLRVETENRVPSK